MAKRNPLQKTILPKMHLVCSDDDLRPALMHVEIKGGIATATNAYVLVRYDLTDIVPEDVLKLLDGTYIHKDFWQRMCAASELEINTMTVVDGIIQLPVLKYSAVSKLSYKPETEFKYPNYMAVINYKECMNAENTIPVIGVNPRLLSMLHEVAKSNREFNEMLALHFSAPNKAIIVTSENNDRFLGLIMPVMLHESSKPISRLAPCSDQ